MARVMARNVAKMTAFLRPRLWMMTCDTFSMDLGSVDSKRTMLGEDRSFQVKKNLVKVSQRNIEDVVFPIFKKQKNRTT